MSLVVAQCTNCGGTLQVDDSHDAAICVFCSTPFIVEKAVHNYQINNSYNIQNANIIMNDDKSLEKRLASAEEYLYYLKDYAAAYRIYDEIEDIAPGNFKVWYGKICSRTMDFNVKSTVELLVNGSIVYAEFERDIDSAYKTVTVEERATFHSKISAFLNGCINELQVKASDMNRVRDDINNDINQRLNNVNSLHSNVNRADENIAGLTKRNEKLFYRERKLSNLKLKALGFGVLIALFLVMIGSFNIRGIIIFSSLVLLIPVCIVIFVRMLVRIFRRTNEEKIRHEMAIRNQNNYDISEHYRIIQENRNNVMGVENELNTCNRYIAAINSIVVKYIGDF